MSDLIDLNGTVVWETSITFEDPALYERILHGDLPTYKVFWTPPNITAMTWPG
jgi:hypothetical protein